MIPFSERYGYKPPKTVMQIDSMDDDLRNSLWNALTEHYWDRTEESLNRHGYHRPKTSDFIKELWADFYKKPIDSIPAHWPDTLKEIRKFFFDCEWYSVYDFVQFVAHTKEYSYYHRQFQNFCDRLLERELSAYRFVSGLIAPITSEEEIVAIEQAQGTSPSSVVMYLKQALTLISQRPMADYLNSCHASINALESICRIIANEPTGKWGLVIKQVGMVLELHSALTGAIDKMYGFASDAGIRHGSAKEPNLDFDDAKCMLVSCSAFVNYLISKAAKSGIDIKL